ncbi:MAG: hypothetical protein II510_04870 [Erysipelotrichales bacterium]|nr:hypothetical protein [Erysipelotrichales bacterium]
MKILCIGDLNADLIVPYGTAKANVGKIVKEKAEVTLRSGGTVGNVVTVLGKLGAKPLFVTNLCTDGTGEFLRKELEKHGADLRYAQVREEETLLCLAVIDEMKDRLVFPWCSPKAHYLRFDRTSFEKIPREDYLVFLSGMVLTNEKTTMRETVRFIRELRLHTESKIVFDCNVRRETYGLNREREMCLHELIRLSDVVLGSRKEDFQSFVPEESLEEYWKSLSEKRVVITREGAEPAEIWQNGRKMSVKPRKVNVLQTIGAGDTFDAAFLYAYALGNTPEKCVRFANRIAGYMISHEGHLRIPQKRKDTWNI